MPPRAPTRVGSLLRKKLGPGTWDDFFRFEFQHKRKKCRRVPSALFLDYPFSSSHASRLDRRCPGRVHGGRRRCDREHRRAIRAISARPQRLIRTCIAVGVSLYDDKGLLLDVAHLGKKCGALSDTCKSGETGRESGPARRHRAQAADCRPGARAADRRRLVDRAAAGRSLPWSSAGSSPAESGSRQFSADERSSNKTILERNFLSKTVS